MIHALRAQVARLAGVLLLSSAVHAAPFESPGILMLGDSQITFGAGPVLLEFLDNIATQCADHVYDQPGRRALEALEDMEVGIIGVRSTSLHSWTARSGRAKGSLCDVDQRWKVNAGTYGVINTSGRRYVQMGKGPQHQVCKAGESGFEAAFREDYYAPALLIMSFLGNASDRWAGEPDLALKDVRRTMEHLPQDLPCVFMTSAPAHLPEVNRKRLRAQENIRAAFDAAGQRCSFVRGFTVETMAINEASPHFFRRRPSGAVKDPYHPVGEGPGAFLASRAPALCEAIAAQTRGRDLLAPRKSRPRMTPRDTAPLRFAAGPPPRSAVRPPGLAALAYAALRPRPEARPAGLPRPAHSLPPRPPRRSLASGIETTASAAGEPVTIP